VYAAHFFVPQYRSLFCSVFLARHSFRDGGSVLAYGKVRGNLKLKLRD